MQSLHVASVRLVERLTSEQIRLLEELRELRDAGILTVDEFDSEVAKVLGRSRVVDDSAPETKTVGNDESSIVVEGSEEEPLAQQNDVPDVVQAPDSTADSGLLEYVFVHEQALGVVESPVADGEDSEATAEEIASDSDFVESIGLRQTSGRRRVFVGAMAGFLLLVVVVVLVVIPGGEASVSTPTSNVQVTVPQSTPVATTQVTMSSVTTSTTTSSTIAPTTTYEILECPYTRVIEAVDGRVVTPEGVTLDLNPATYFFAPADGGRGYFWGRGENGYGAGIEGRNTTNFRLRIGMQLEWSWPNGSLKSQWEPDNGRGWINGFETRTILLPNSFVDSQEPITEIRLRIVNATIQYLCP